MCVEVNGVSEDLWVFFGIFGFKSGYQIGSRVRERVCALLHVWCVCECVNPHLQRSAAVHPDVCKHSSRSDGR